MTSLTRDGFQIVKNFITQNEVDICLSQIKQDIKKASKEIEVNTEEYLSATGRWGPNSFITQNISKILLDRVKSSIEHILNVKIEYKKSNIICKTHILTDRIAFHQDISYSKNDPYHFSLWLSFNDVHSNSAPLQVIKGSHNEPIEPAIDFWSPMYDKKYDYNDIESEILTVNASDAIIFDARIWHGSDNNYSGNDRFAYVTRWKIHGKNFPTIPNIKPLPFGMFNCGDLTDKILRESIKLYNSEQYYSSLSREEIIIKWIEFLENNPDFQVVNQNNSKKDLEKLMILNRACELHDAGNISGLVYKNLWYSMLEALNRSVRVIDI